MKRHFAKDNVQVANKHMEMCYTSWAIKGMKIKSTVMYHYTAIRVANIIDRNHYIAGENIN